MNPMSRLLHRMREHGSSPLGRESPRVDGVLTAHFQRVREADPETVRQWRMLEIAMEREGRAAALPTASLRLRLVRPAISIAIMAAAIVVIGILWEREPSAVTYETGRGQQSSITLPDSSQIALNHTSKLTVDPRSEEGGRHVALRGEAFFRVRKAGEPFIVDADFATIRVMGTEFNVLAREDRLEVAVLTGSVQVTVHRNGRDSTLTLAGGQIATCSREDFPADPGQLLFTEYPGWMHGKFLFFRTSLQSACKEIESHFDVAVRIADPREGGETITGAVDAHTAESALSTLVTLTGKKYRHDKNGYTVY